MLATVWVLICSHAAEAEPAEPRFVERAVALGIDFVHRHFGTGEKTMPENMGPGVALFDADGDGRLDVYLVQGAPLGPRTSTQNKDNANHLATNRLFRQSPSGRFVDVTEQAGVGDAGYGMGASFGDLDADGDLDLYVTNFGRNTLYLNRGAGTFEDVTVAAGVGSELWSTSSGFFDADADGDLDLFVANYVDFAFDRHKWCGDAGRKLRSYCHPDVYDGLPDVLYRNDGIGDDGAIHFTEVSRPAGLAFRVEAKGLGVGFGDLDGDGHQDIYVANDSTPNFLYLGDGRGRFTESALLAGVGFNGAGAAEASMGVAIADLDGDGRTEIFLTHLDKETHTLYRNLGDGLWTDATESAGLSGPSLPWVGFGAVAFDHDNDGDRDLFVTQGHIIDNIELFDPARSHRQPSQLYDNLTVAPGKLRFADISPALGFGPLVGRGAAAGDLDGDGDLDLVLTQNNDRAVVLVNRWGARAQALAVRLVGQRSNPQGFGARLELTSGSRRQVSEVVSASSYLSQGPPDVYFGLGDRPATSELIVHWPSGQVDRHPSLKAGQLYIVREGSPTVDAKPFRRASP